MHQFDKTGRKYDNKKPKNGGDNSLRLISYAD